MKLRHLSDIIIKTLIEYKHFSLQEGKSVGGQRFDDGRTVLHSPDWARITVALADVGSTARSVPPRHRRHAALGLGLASLLASCASVTSLPYDSAAPIEGVLYKLPATEIAAESTWVLESCVPSPRLALVDLKGNHRVVADPDPKNWYVIDPDELSDLFTSVNPARIELKDGVLTAVEYKAASELGEVIKTGVGLAARVVAPVPGFERTRRPPRCRSGTQAALERTAEAAKRASERLEAVLRDLAAVERSFFRAPTEAGKLAVDYALARVAEARAALGDARPRLAVAVSGRPNRGEPEFDLLPDLLPFEAWFEPFAPRGAEEQWLASETLVRAKLAPVVPIPGPLAEEAGAFPGIYHRIPAVAHITLENREPTTGEVRRVHTVRDVPVAQLGRTARLRLENIPFGSRGFAVKFGAGGEVVSYEATSTAIAKEAVATAAGARQAIIEAGAAEVQAEVDRLKREIELVEQRRRLRELRGQAAPAADGG